MDARAETLEPSARPSDLLSDLVSEALRRGASRLHLEPREDGLSVRFRISGALTEVLRVAAPAAREVLRRAGTGNVDGHDCAAFGGRYVVHLDTPDDRAGRLHALGMRPALVRGLGAALERGRGLVLVAGPAGSGRSTTVAALGTWLDNGARCVLSIAEGEGTLTEAMRQDADVILAGTITDRESAAAAVRAAEAGHLVIAEIGASDAVAAILAMRAFRVEPFQLASTLQAVLAERLVAKLCPECRVPVQATGSVSALLGFDSGAVVYAPAGCGSCAESGFAGRTGVFEAILADAALRRLVNDGGDGAIIARHAFLNAPNLGSAARALVREGVTTPDEAVRVSRG